MADADPQKWTVDEVARYFRHEAGGAALAARPAANLPDFNNLADKFEEHEVDGAVLFSDVDGAFLKDDCGIGKLGQRSVVMMCISQLKSRSKLCTQKEQHQTPDTSFPSTAQLPGLDITTFPQTPPELSPGGNVRKGEHQVEDQSGRKRRKLDLTKMTPVQKEQTVPASSLSRPAGYLGHTARPVDQLFFGNAALGGVVEDLVSDGEILPNENECQDPELALTNFQFQAPYKMPGEIEYVYGRTRHLLRLQAEDALEEEGNARHVRQIKRHGRLAVAVLPYQSRVCTKNKSQSAMVFQLNEGEEDAVVVRENAAYLDSDMDYNGLPQEPDDGSFDYLIAKYKQKDDEALPLWDRDDPDACDSLPESLFDEIEAEDEGDEQVLKVERLKQVIQQGLASLAEKIKEKKLPTWNKHAWTVWKKTKQSRSIRRALIAGADRLVKHLEARIDKLTEAMLAEEWASEKQVLDDCDRFEATIEDIEKQRWKKEIWKLKQEPFHQVRRHQHTRTVSASAKASDQVGFQVRPEDRFSVEPTPPVVSEEQEDFHSARGSPVPVGAIGQGENEDASDEMSIDGRAEDEADFVDEKPIHISSSPPHSNYSETQASSPSASAKANGTMSPAWDDEDSDIAQPDDALANFLKSAKPEKKTPVKQSAASSSALQNSPIEISSDSAPATPGKGKKKRGPKSAVYSEQPELDTAAEVQGWDLQDLVRRSDRKRIVIKLLSDAGDEVRQKLKDLIRKLRVPVFSQRVSELLNKFRVSWHHSADPSVEFATKLFLAWTLSAPGIVTDTENTDVPWSSLHLDKLSVETLVRQVEMFLQRPNLWKARKVSSTPAKSTPNPKSSIVIDISSGEEAHGSTGKRKSKPRLNDAAAQSQFAALERQMRAKAVEAQASNSQELQAMIQANPSRSTVPINLSSKQEDEGLIFIHEDIAQHLKDHQISGIRFMWRELTARDGGDDDREGAQGCILAHEMGLGKTLQTIAVLVAINEAAQSDNPAIFRQIPKHLRPRAIKKRQLRMLILCPPTLIQNWRREINQWAPYALSNVFSVEAGMQVSESVVQLKNWSKVGGVLLIGYDLFRNKLKASEKEARSDDVGPDMEKYLLQYPELVVADEAHGLRNDASATSQIVGSIHTHARIGLTGTPMSNDVDEIYSLISFVAPNYLGEKVWFNSMFSKPIKEGNSYDSTTYEVRRSLKKLAVLRAQIEPKVDRKDITVLRGSLKPKVEFVITLSLTELQRNVYNKYLAVVLGDSGRANETSQVKIFSWLAVLTLLTNHPLSFKEKLFEPPKSVNLRAKAGVKIANRSRRPSRGASDSGADTPIGPERRDDDESIADLDTTLRALGLSQEAISDLTADIPDDDNPVLSAKMSMLFEILRLAKQVGDKVLIFSSKLLTLDYVQRVLTKNKIKCGRIDGSVPTPKRQQLVEDFNHDKTEVMLISTKAGGVGLNMQRANRVVILDFGFNPSHEIQAIGRAFRLGQQKPVFVYRLIVGGTFEEKIYNMQMFKMSLTQRVVDKKNPRRNATGTASTWLFPPKDLEQKDLREYVGMDEVLDVILKRQLSSPPEVASVGPSIRGLDTIETLQADANDAPLNDEEQKEVEAERAIWLRERQNIKKAGNLSLSQPAMPPPGVSSTAPVKSRAFNGVPTAGKGLSRMVSFPMPVPHGLPMSRRNVSIGGAARPSSTAPHTRTNV